ncbi:Isotrichodermin C-15 hydroxylase [Neonectria ditissima]|uniref:Isotrichodermin C-15 hydroxylase n=1 Tax=Neonectria ditissima TaxID=78410 RepID=A0A0P7ANA3_9HYPO|nr:Isotrichodermin C-15 hydroxylase [Neonectria ditissima]
MRCILYLYIGALVGVVAVLAQSNATHVRGFPGLAVFARSLAKPHQYQYKPDQHKRQQTPVPSASDEPTATDAEPTETEVDDSTATEGPSATDNEDSTATGSDAAPTDDAESTADDGPTATESGDAAETTSDEDDDSPSETESSGASATNDDDSSTATDKSDPDNTSSASGSSKTGGASSKGSDNEQTGLVAVDARDGTESSQKTPADVTTPDQHNAESKANLPQVVISGDDAKEVVVMEAVMFDYFATKDPAPADKGQIKLSSNVSDCKVGIQKRSTSNVLSRDLRQDCKYVTSLEFDIYFNYVRSTIDSERPNNLEDRVETSVGLLNDVFGPLGINFTYRAYQQWAPPESGSNKDWSKVTQFEKRLEQWQTDTHTGNEMTLNVWLVNDLRSDDGDKELNAYASFPWDKKGPLDGIVVQQDRINKDTIPTFVHEIGHWLGLRHTFREQVDKADQDCGVADGLIDSSVTTGLVDKMFDCSQTTCYGSGSKDIVNYMSYSQCRGKVPEDGFTTDQKSAIYSRVLKYRRGYRDGECTAQYTDSADAKKMMKRSTMQDLVDGDCPNIAAGVEDLQGQPTSTNSGVHAAYSLCYILAAMAGSLFVMIWFEEKGPDLSSNEGQRYSADQPWSFQYPLLIWMRRCWKTGACGDVALPRASWTDVRFPDFMSLRVLVATDLPEFLSTDRPTADVAGYFPHRVFKKKGLPRRPQSLNMGVLAQNASELPEIHLATALPLLSIGLGLGYLLVNAIYNVYFHPLRNIPGPKLWAMTLIPYTRMYLSGRAVRKVLELHKTYGPVVRLAPGIVAFSHPDSVKEIRGHRKAGKSEHGKDPNHLGPLSKTIIGADRVNHSRYRRSLAHGFSAQAMLDQQPIIRQYVDMFIEKLRLESAGGTNQIDMVKWFNYTTFDIIGDLAFGEPFGCLKESTYHGWVALVFSSIKSLAFSAQLKPFHFISPLLSRFIIPKSLATKLAEHNQLSAAKVSKRLATQSDRPDFITAMTTRRGSSKGDNLTFDELASHASVLITAGSETTATALSAVAYYLSMNPKALSRLTEEVRTTFATEDEIDLLSVQKLSYMLAVLDEGMRLYPPAPGGQPRIISEGGAEVVGVYVPAGTKVEVWQWATHHNPANFTLPDEFIPERWLGDARFANDKTEAFQPFSVGPRNCIGKK